MAGQLRSSALVLFFLNSVVRVLRFEQDGEENRAILLRMANSMHTHARGTRPILRDYLATDRTILANERTLLAYARTALTLLIVGATFIKFFDSAVLEIIGWTFIPLSLIAMNIGHLRYRRMKKFIKELEEKNGLPDLEECTGE